LLGRVLGSNPSDASHSLLTGSIAEKEGVLDALLALTDTFPTDLRRPVLERPLRIVSQSGNRLLRAKAAVLLLRWGDSTEFENVIKCAKPQRHHDEMHQVSELCWREIQNFVAQQDPSALRALTSNREINHLVLAEIARNHRELLSEDGMIEWALGVLADVKWETAVQIRHNLVETVPLWAPKLSELVEHGNARHRYQAGQLLALSGGLSREKRG
jgi:hypothetical protein